MTADLARRRALLTTVLGFRQVDWQFHREAAMVRAVDAGTVVAEVVDGRLPNGRFAQGNQAAVGHGGPAGPSKKILRAVLLQALAGEQMRGKGKNRHPVKAAGMLDAVESVQLILRRRKVEVLPTDRTASMLDPDSGAALTPDSRSATVPRVTNTLWQHPWLRIERLIRSIVHERWDKATRPKAENMLERTVEEKKRTARQKGRLRLDFILVEQGRVNNLQ